MMLTTNVQSSRRTKCEILEKESFRKGGPLQSKMKTTEKIDHSKVPENKALERHSRHGKGHKFNYKHLQFLEPTVNIEDVPPPPASTVLSMARAPDGGKIVSVRDSEGKIQVRIEYEREQILKLASSPFAVLPPACIKEVVTNMPELIVTFPVRHLYG